MPGKGVSVLTRAEPDRDRPPSPGKRPLVGWPRGVLAVVVTGAAYYVGARVGLLPALVRGQITPFWPPTGIAVACMLTLGLRAWPGVAIASFAVNAPLGPSVAAAVGIAAGNTLAPVLAVLVLRRLRVSFALARLRDAALFVLIGVTSMLVSATSGTTVLRVSGVLADRQYWSAWSVWWAGDAMGVLLVAPVVLLLTRTARLRRVRPMPIAEAVVLFACVAAVMRYFTTTSSPAGILICPLLVWAAMRFRQAGAALVALEVSVFASAATSAHGNAFVRGGTVHSMLILQVFNASVALTGLLLAAAISQLDDSRRDLAIANTVLSERFEARGAQLDHDRSRIAVLAHRQQLATQLQDTVLQRLFGVGTALDAAATTLDEDAKRRLGRVIDDLDGTINDLAVAIYQADEAGAEFTFRDAVRDVIAAGSQPSERAPTLSMHGDENDIPLALRPQILAALQESLVDMTAGAVNADLTIALTISNKDVCILIARRQAGAPTGLQEGIRRAQARAHRLGGICKWQTTADASTFELVFPTRPDAA